jgi:translation initiation factor 3 subunit B
LLDGHRLDKNHVFSAYSMTQLKTATRPPDNWKAPTPRAYVDAGDLWWWLQNPKCYDQFGIQVENPRTGSVALAVYNNYRGTDPQLASDDSVRDQWSEHIFKWSPYGTYLTSMHKQGVALWAGEKFERVQRLSHDNVNFIEFSPRETYIVTYSHEDTHRHTGENCLRIFDVFTGESKKSFNAAGSGQTRIHDWPFFKWSHDEKYFAFCRPKANSINVFETHDFSLCDKKPIEMEGLVTFEWSPSKNVMAYYCEERPDASAPAEIGIIEFPSRQKIRAQRIFNVSQAQLFWQKSGARLAAHTERYNARKKDKDGEIKLTGAVSHLEIFDCTGKEVAYQTTQLPEPFVAFGWEPNGNKFCVLVGGGNKVTPQVYKTDSTMTSPLLISKIEPGIQLNTVLFAPQGASLAVFAANSSTGHVFFIDTGKEEATRLRIVEHGSMNQGSWDPTGRYFATCSLGRNRSESGYRIHTFQGRELVRKNIETLIRFKWRPRPPVELSDAKKKEIRKNLKQTAKKFEEEDRREQLIVSKELLEKRRKVMEEFNAVRHNNRAMYEKESEERAKLRRGVDTDLPQQDLVEETITIPLTTEIKPIKDEEDKE